MALRYGSRERCGGVARQKVVTGGGVQVLSNGKRSTETGMRGPQQSQIVRHISKWQGGMIWSGWGGYYRARALRQCLLEWGNPRYTESTKVPPGIGLDNSYGNFEEPTPQVYSASFEQASGPLNQYKSEAIYPYEVSREEYVEPL